MAGDDRARRAEVRRHSATIHRTRLGANELDLSPVRGEDAISLVTLLTRESWSESGAPAPAYSRAQIPVRFVAGRLT